MKIGTIELEDFPLLLAPMEDVSDPPFRALCKKHGADMMYTEFISSEGLIRHADKSVEKLDIYDYERPIGIQIFGDQIESMRQAAAIAEEAQPELIDINYGCPVTVKTRLGWDDSSIRILEVAKRLQDVGIQALTIHGRTRKQMYKGVADWTKIAEVKHHPDIHIPIFGNGDVDSPEKALEYRQKFGVDGIMIGRGAIGYPWIFNEIKHYFRTGEKLAPPTLSDRVGAAREHLDFSIEWKGERKGIYEMRRHYTNYFRGIQNFKPYRTKLVTSESYDEVKELLDEIDTVFSDEHILIGQ
jgi:tRNA-dihydrouridine synthase B